MPAPHLAPLLATLLALPACGGAPPAPDATAPAEAEAAPTACKPDHPCVAEITGSAPTCFRLRSGEIRCVGQNNSHLIGRDSYDARTRATPLQQAPRADDLHVGQGFACALLPGGAVECWGSRLYGRLGDGQTEGSREAPAPVEGLPPVVELAGGFDSTCARAAEGAVWCWGSDIEGEQGNGDGGPTTSLDEVCGRAGDGAAWCFGDIRAAAPDDGDGGDAPRPHRLALPPVDALAAGAHHYCAVARDDRAIWCWGAHSAAFEPDPIGHSMTVPTRLDALGPLAPGGRLALQLWAACVVEPTVGARCWGANRGYLVGDWFDAPNTGVSVIPDARDVIVALEHACVVSAAGRVRCAGLESDGQLGAPLPDGDADWAEPVMPFPEPVERLHALPASTCAISERGDVACWGVNDRDQLGVGPTDEVIVPRPTRPAW